MNLVFTKTRELGEALMMSEEYKAMKDAEAKAMGNAKAALLMGKLLETRQTVEGMLIEADCDGEALRRLSGEMDALQEELQAIDDVQELTRTRDKFSQLIAQVNKVLQFIITGEMPSDEEEDGFGGTCSGNCASCGGACSKPN